MSVREEVLVERAFSGPGRERGENPTLLTALYSRSVDEVRAYALNKDNYPILQYNKQLELYKPEWARDLFKD